MNQTKEIVGQNKLIFYINTWIESCTKQSLLLRGPSGCGKTEIAKLYASLVNNGNYHYFLCGERRRINPPRGEDPVILDEIHALKNIEQWFNVPNILIGCTTESTPVPDSLKSRMFETWFEPYSQDDLLQIVMNTVEIPELAATIVAERCRDNPRIAIQIANQIKAYTSLNDISSREGYESICNWFGFYEHGLSEKDHAYMKSLKDGPRSIRTISVILSVPEETILEEIEPFLLRRELISISNRGRELA